MPEFISKLQYKTSEEGEYADEKVRNLQETVDLINNFPWAREQYADVDLTGPSITIEDEAGNYLKAGIYFGGKYSLYYFDAKHIYYEKKNVTIDFVFGKVNEFFEGKIDLHNFEKSRPTPGTKGCFTTNKFEYRITFWDVFLLSFYWFFFFVVLLILSTLIIRVSRSLLTISIALIPTLILGGILFYIFSKYQNHKSQYLKISRGNNEFQFGEADGEIKTFNKAEIVKVIRYIKLNYRGINDFEIFAIHFNNGERISFSNMLIDEAELARKFSDKWKYSPVVVRKNTLWML